MKSDLKIESPLKMKLERNSIMKNSMSHFRSDFRAAAAVEFAIVAPFFFGLLIAAIDLGHYAYVRSIVNGAMLKAGRDSSLESGTTANAAIDDSVKSQVGTVIKGATYVFTRNNFADPSDIGQPERFDDSDGSGTRDAGECFDDYNKNGIWDAQRGRSGQGGAKAYVVYKVSVTYNRILPAFKFLGLSPTHTVESQTILANQPYTLATTETVPTICT